MFSVCSTETLDRVIASPYIDAEARLRAGIFEATTSHRKLLVIRNPTDLEACGNEGFRPRRIIYGRVRYRLQSLGLWSKATFCAQVF